MNALFTAPLGPNCDAASTGENTKALTVAGVTVFLIKLVSPKIKPKNAPLFGPRKIAPRITGMWIIVALITPSGMYPSGVKAMIIMIAVKSAVSTKSSVFFLIF